jgi:hypothetical protein
MVMRPSSPERWRSSLAHKAVVARLDAGGRAVNGVRGAVEVRECAADGTGTPLEWLAHRPPRGDVLIAMMTS